MEGAKVMIDAGGSSSLTPSRDAMRQFLNHLFGGYLDGLHDGLIEISHVENQGDKPIERWRSKLFGTDEIEDAVDFASAMNAQRYNVYVAPALRHPDADRNKRASKDQVMGTVVLWCEWDDVVDFEEAQKKYQFVKPTAGIITGTVPSRRCQAFWRIDEALYDKDEIDGALIGLQAALYGDYKVTHADGLMRLAGSVSWRKLDKPERVDEQTILVMGQDGMPPSYPVGQILQAFPPQERKSPADGFRHPEEIERHKNSLGLDAGRVEDGRETYMRDTVLACLVEFAGQNGAWPTAQELFDIAWPQYSKNVDFSRPGRGDREFFGKCRYTVQRAEKEQIKNRDGSRMTLQSAVAAYAKKQKKRTENASVSEKSESSQSDVFNLFDWTANRYTGQAPAIKWLCEGTVPLGIPMLLAAMGGVGKSFLSLDMALSIASGVTSLKPKHCLGGDIMSYGTAVVLSAEDSQESIHRRFNAIDPDSHRLVHPDKLIVVPMPNAGGPRPLIGNNGKTFGKTEFFDQLKNQLCQIGDLRLVVIDPLQAFVMADVNSDPAAGQFMWSAFAEICAMTGATVMVCHHMKKDDGAPVKTADEARAAIRGSSALVDGARLSYALWKVEEGRARALCRETGIEYENGVVIDGAVVKANDKANKEPTTYVRQDSGLLIPSGISSQVVSADRRSLNAGQLRSLLNEVNARWLAGNPFSHSHMSGGLWLGKYIISAFSLRRDDAKDIVDSLVSQEILVIEKQNSNTKKTGLKVQKWSNAPGEAYV
jgi:hypothetical protein